MTLRPPRRMGPMGSRLGVILIWVSLLWETALCALQRTLTRNVQSPHTDNSNHSLIIFLTLRSSILKKLLLPGYIVREWSCLEIITCRRHNSLCRGVIGAFLILSSAVSSLILHSTARPRTFHHLLVLPPHTCSGHRD